MVLVVIIGVLQLPSGLLALFQSFGSGNWFAQGIADVELLWYASLKIAFGILTIVVGATLGGGSQVARVLVTIVLALVIASAFFGFRFGLFGITDSVVGLILSVLSLVLLYTTRANAFFRRT